MRKRRLCCRQAVRLSVTLIDCIQTAEDIVKLLVRPGSPINMFLTHAPIPNAKGNPFSGAQNANFAIFQGNRRLSETVRDSPMVDMER